MNAANSHHCIAYAPLRSRPRASVVATRPVPTPAEASTGRGDKSINHFARPLLRQGRQTYRRHLPAREIGLRACSSLGSSTPTW